MALPAQNLKKLLLMRPDGTSPDDIYGRTVNPADNYGGADATFANQGVAGVAGENIGKMAARIGGGAETAHESAKTLLSGAMEGTGKLLFGRGNKPTFGMDSADPSLPAVQSSVSAKPTPVGTVPAVQPSVSATSAPALEVPEKSPVIATVADPIKINPLTLPDRSTYIGSPTTVAGVLKRKDANGGTVYGDAAGIQQEVATPKPTLGGGGTPQSRYAEQQAQVDAGTGSTQSPQLAMPSRYQPRAVQSNVTDETQQAIQNAILNNVAAGQRVASSGSKNVGDLLAAKYAHMQNSDLLGNDVANQGLQVKANDQAQQDSQFIQTLADKQQQSSADNMQKLLETAQKSGYYESEANKNNAQAKTLLMPKEPEQVKQIIGKDANDNPIMIDPLTNKSTRIMPSADDVLRTDFEKRQGMIDAIEDPEKRAVVQAAFEKHPDYAKAKKLMGS